jgi:hypothetical protein
MVFGSVCFVVSMADVLIDFRTQALLMRKGKSMFQQEGEVEASLADAAEFPGLFTVNCSLGFLVFCVLFMLIFVVLYHPLFWLLIYENLWAIGFILIWLVVDMILECIVKKTLYIEEVKYRYRLLGQIYEIYKFVSGLIAGIAVECGRIIYALLALLISIIRLNRPMVPAWICDIMALDAQYAAYASLVGVYETYNNPVANTFVTLVLKSAQGASARRGKALLRHAIEKRWLILHGERRICATHRLDAETSEEKLRINSGYEAIMVSAGSPN